VAQKKLQSFTKAVLADSSKLSVANLFEMSAK